MSNFEFSKDAQEFDVDLQRNTVTEVDGDRYEIGDDGTVYRVGDDDTFHPAGTTETMKVLEAYRQASRIATQEPVETYLPETPEYDQPEEKTEKQASSRTRRGLGKVARWGAISAISFGAIHGVGVMGADYGTKWVIDHDNANLSTVFHDYIQHEKTHITSLFDHNGEDK